MEMINNNNNNNNDNNNNNNDYNNNNENLFSALSPKCVCVCVWGEGGSKRFTMTDNRYIRGTWIIELQLSWLVS